MGISRLSIFVSTTGVDEDMQKISKVDLKYGRFITKCENASKKKVAVIGDQANKEIFG